MVLNLEQMLGSKNSLAVLRLLTAKPYLSFGLTEISQLSNISKSNILRVLKPLREQKIVLEHGRGRKKVMQINTEHPLAEKLWELFMLEKQSSLPPEIKNAVDSYYAKIKEKAEVFILFGSVARGKEQKESDIDILIVGDKKISGPVFDFLPYRIEVHNYPLEALKERKDLVILDSLIQGIVYRGNIFPIIKELKYFPRSYLVYRLNKSKEFLSKAKNLKGKAKRFYLDLAKISLGEVESVYRKGKTVSKREIYKGATFKKIRELEAELANGGENIWLV